MPLADTRLAAQAAFVARRLLADGCVKASAPAELRRAVEAALKFDRDRERQLDEEVQRLLLQNASAIRSAGEIDHAEMFRKAKKMLAEKKKIPL